MFGQKKKKDKYTLEEYQKIKAERDKKKFRFELYPWPVSLALSVPLLFLIVIFLGYVLYVKRLSGD